MVGAIPSTTKQWTVVGQDGIESLKYEEVPTPIPKENEVLVRSAYVFLK
jgi:NADPH:quinone reductase-like Zn-dependent oxidoreductase